MGTAMTRKALFPLALACALLAVQPDATLAQTSDTEQQTTAQQERFDRAEDLRLNSRSVGDMAEAYGIHAALVGEGYERSLVPLGELQFEKGDFAAAIDSWQRAADGGNDYAAFKLAEGHVTKQFDTLSRPEEGLTAMEVLAGKGNERAVFVLGDLYFRGEHVPANPARALELLASLTDNPSALTRVGKLYLGGDLGKVYPEGAIAAFGSAVALGYAGGLVDLAQAQMAGGHFEDALASMDKAVQLQVPKARYRYARWHIDGDFGHASDRAAGTSMLKTLIAERDLDAAMFASYRYVDGPKEVRDIDIESILAILDDAVETGDETAARILGRALRKLDMPSAKARYAKLLREHGDLLGDIPVHQRINALFDPNDKAGSQEMAVQLLDPAKGEDFSKGLLMLRSIEKNIYVYMVQRELRSQGIYQGDLDGMLTNKTLSAMIDFCKQAGINKSCVQGPFSIEASRAIADALGARKAAAN